MKSQAVPTMYLYLIEISLVLFSGVIIYNKIASIEGEHLFESKVFVRDVALILDTLPMIPGNIRYTYNPPTLRELDVAITDDAVTVGKQSYRYSRPPNQHLSYQFEKPERLNFYTEGGRLKVDTAEQPNWNPLALKCSAVDVSVTKLVIDPAYGTGTGRFSGSSGKNGAAGTEANLMLAIAARLGSIARQRNIIVEGTRDFRQQEAKRVSERIIAIRSDAVVLGLSAGEDAGNKNVLKIYVNARSPKYAESYSLACKLLNTITGDVQITGASIVPVDTARLKQDDQTTDEDEADIRNALLRDNTGIYVELGNINIANNPLLKSTIADKIFEALQ